MRNSTVLLLALKVLGRILKSDRRGTNKPALTHKHHSDNTHNDSVHDDPDHVDFDYRRKRHGRGKHGDHHTGTVVHVRKRNTHPHHHGHSHPTGTVEEAVREDIKRATGAHHDSDLSVAARTLAREAGRGNPSATRRLRDEGALTEPFGTNLLNAQARSPHTGLTTDEVADALQNTPHTSAPMNYSSMKEVKAGANPELDRTLSAQKLMEWFRNSLPKVGGGAASEEIMSGAAGILARAPGGNINAPFEDTNGHRTGRTFGEEAESFVRKAAPLVGGALGELMGAGLSRAEAQQRLGAIDSAAADCEINGTCHPLTAINERIDESMLGSIPSPTIRAQHEFENLVRNGVPPANAAHLAGRVEQSAMNEIGERVKLADALKENAKEGFVAANHRQLQREIEGEKNLDRANMIGTMNEEVIKQRSFPNLHPIHLNEDELGYLRQLGNQLTPVEIGRRMFDAYAKSAQAGETEEDALDAAGRTGYLLSEFNNELRKGVPPETAADMIKERGNIQDAVDQRRSFVQNNGPEIAQLVAENTQLVQGAAAKIARTPERKDEILEELDNDMRNLAAKHADFIHEKANVEDIHKPRKAAEDLIDETKFINDELMHIARQAPIVAKDIIKKGMDNARQAASEFNNTLNHVNGEEKKHSPIPKSALRLLDEAKKEQQLDQIARKNAEAEKKHRDALLKENKDAEVMATEERLARDNKARKINEEGMKVAENVLRSGGTIEEARAAKTMAEQNFAHNLENKEASIRNDVLRSLSSGVDSKRAKQIAAHVAAAHSGDNAIGKTPEEVMKNELEDRKKEALERALYSDFSNEKVDVVKIIPNDASEVNINNSVIKFPLNTFVDETPRDKGEEFVKNRADVLKNLVRNTVTRNKINSGLNTIQTSDGFMNLGENSNKVHVQAAVAFIKPSGKIQMENEGIDTSNWKSRHNQGERPDIPNGELYYEADVTDADLPLPSPINKAPGKFMSNADEQLDANYIDELHIKRGTLNQVPWTEFSDLVKPRLNLYPNEEEKIKEANLFKNAMAEEKKKEKLDSIKIISFTNPNGDKHITTVPQYGIPETFEEKEGMKRLSNINPDKNVAISETPTEAQKEPMINPLENIPDDQVLNSFVENTIAEGRAKNKAGRFVSPTNGFTNQEDRRKSTLLQIERFDITKHFINDGSVASRIKNDLISHTSAFSKALGMEKEAFINLIKRIPDSTIYKMDQYNSEPEKKATDLLDTDFSKSITNISTNVQPSTLLNFIFNSISNITGKPNNVTSTVLEKHIVPNLKAIEHTETYRTPDRTTQYQTVEPPKPGTTVISEHITNGPPNISTGANTSYTLPDPTKPPFKQYDNKVHNPGTEPLSAGEAPFNQASGASTRIPAAPSDSVGFTVPGVSPQTQQRAPSNAPKAGGPVGGPRAGPAGGPRAAPTTPSTGTRAGGPRTAPAAGPGQRIGIASSPQK